MNPQLTLDNIDRLQASPVGQNRWQITFRSANDGLCHQLYVNGRLADWTETPQARSFALATARGPMDIVIAAVEHAYRQADLSPQIGEGASPSWVVRMRLARLAGYPRSSSVGIVVTPAWGDGDPAVMDIRPAWPAWAAPCAMGEDAFGRGAFGYGGAGGPGLGMGPFATGPFGLGADDIALQAVLPEEGAYQVAACLIQGDGTRAMLSPRVVLAMPPPPPPRHIEVVAYDSQTSTFILHIE